MKCQENLPPRPISAPFTLLYVFERQPGPGDGDAQLDQLNEDSPWISLTRPQVEGGLILCHLPEGKRTSMAGHDCIDALRSKVFISGPWSVCNPTTGLKKIKKWIKKKTLCSFAERLCLRQTNGGRAQRYQAVLWTWNASRRAVCPERLHADRIRERTDAQWRRAETRGVKQMSLRAALNTNYVDLWPLG